MCVGGHHWLTIQVTHLVPPPVPAGCQEDDCGGLGPGGCLPPKGTQEAPDGAAERAGTQG